MIINMIIDVENNSVFIDEELEFGTKKNKVIALDEFLQGYASLIKEKNDKNDFIFFPPGTVEYRKNLNNCTFVVQTAPYKEYYGLSEEDYDLLLILKMNLDCNLVFNYTFYKTNGHFNKRLSSFIKIFNSDKSFFVDNEVNAISVCLEKIKKSSFNTDNISLNYEDIFK